MLIDWFTVGAQVVNFLILVAILRIFLYGRIVRAMEEREDRIESQFREAEETRDEAEENRKGYEEKLKQVDQEREERIRDAEHRAEQKHAELVQEAREEVEKQRRRWFELLREEQRMHLDEFDQESRKVVLDATRRALRQLAGQDLETKMIELFLDKLREEKERIQQALAESDRVIVATSFELEAALRKKVEEGVRDAAERQDLGVDFEQSDELLCGIRVAWRGHKTEWSFRKFLDELGGEFRETMNTEVEQSTQ